MTRPLFSSFLAAANCDGGNRLFTSVLSADVFVCTIRNLSKSKRLGCEKWEHFAVRRKGYEPLPDAAVDITSGGERSFVPAQESTTSA